MCDEEIMHLHFIFLSCYFIPCFRGQGLGVQRVFIFSDLEVNILLRAHKYAPLEKAIFEGPFRHGFKLFL